MRENTRRRTSSAVVRRRLDHYPFADWLRRCVDGTDKETEVWLTMEIGVDYNCTTNQFRTEMHRLAARETKRRETVGGYTAGVIARTTEATDDSITIRFEEVPFEATPGFNTRKQRADETRVNGICRLTMPPHTFGMPMTGMTCPCTGELDDDQAEAVRVITTPPLFSGLAIGYPPPPNSEAQGMEMQPAPGTRVEGYAVLGLPDEPKAGDQVTVVPAVATFVAPGQVDVETDGPAPDLGDGFGGLTFDEWLATQDQPEGDAS